MESGIKESKSSPYILGDYIGFTESLRDEFKEFMFKSDPEIFLSEKEIEVAVIEGKIPKNFNEVILANLLHYFQVYLPKYISAFSNCDELKEGHLYFGVNNIGEITGIPYHGELTEKDMATLMKSIKDFIFQENKEAEGDLMDQIQIELHQLEIDNDLIPDNTDKEINFTKEKYEEYCQAYKIFCEEKTKWLEELNSFNNKISYMILDPKIREDISIYIRTNASHRNNIAEILESDIPIEILNGIQLNDYKSSDDNVYYWVMFYKDYTIAKIRARKPIKPEYSYNELSHLYCDYFRCLTKLRYKFLSNNTEIKYYLLKIVIPGKKNFRTYYKHPIYEWKWMTKIRSIGIQGPCCI